jgi:membrane protein
MERNMFLACEGKPMEADRKVPPINTDASTKVAQAPARGFKSLLELWIKFNNDWVMNFASGLAFNLLVALIPITMALISLGGFIYGGLDPSVKEDLINSIQHAFPPPIPSTEVVSLALNFLNKNAGLLGIIAIGFAVFAGSGLFLSMEGYFAIIYQTRTRGLIHQYIMAIGMILLFVVLIPPMILADTLPTLVNSLLSKAPELCFFNYLVGIPSGIVVGWVLLEIIYRNAAKGRGLQAWGWKGAADRRHLSSFSCYKQNSYGGAVRP